MTGAIVALDLASTTGFAVRLPNGTITSGTHDFRSKRYEGGGMRYLRFRFWLNELKEGFGEISAIYFEEVRNHVGTDAAHVHGGLLGQLTAWCEEHSIPYSGVGVGTIKKSATGKGNASKQDVIEAMIARGHSPQDDNEADALALLYCVIGGND